LWAIFNTFYKLFITVNTKYSESMKWEKKDRE
jgi:hypothetical protein